MARVRLVFNEGQASKGLRWNIDCQRSNLREVRPKVFTKLEKDCGCFKVTLPVVTNEYFRPSSISCNTTQLSVIASKFVI